jgi:hypothetical protein
LSINNHALDKQGLQITPRLIPLLAIKREQTPNPTTEIIPQHLDNPFAPFSPSF